MLLSCAHKFGAINWGLLPGEIGEILKESTRKRAALVLGTNVLRPSSAER